MPRQYICSNCGAVVPKNLYFSRTSLAALMRAQSLCFDCAFWTDYAQHPIADTYIINRGLYTFFPQNNKNNPKRKKIPYESVYAINIRTKEAVYSTVLEHIANVPDRLKSQFPDQYKFITRDAYQALSKRICKECLAKGCWDRYNCFWYNREKAEGNKPWNDIPRTHKPGDEHCETFINKSTMYQVNIEELTV